MLDISIILPVHNEEQGISEFIKRLYNVFKKTKISFEVICVENGSTDNSFKILKKLTRKYSNMIVLQSELGWGNAVIKGIKSSKAKYVCYMVSDNQIDPENIFILYEKIRNNHKIAAKITRVNRENLLRLITSRAYNVIASRLFNLSISDINGTPKLFERNLLKDIKFEANNIAFDLELLIKFQKLKVIWIEVPVNSYQRATGFSSTNAKSVFEMLDFIIRFYIKRIQNL